ncbi:PDZ domain-containing protein [Thioalkalicoccus limnaeus]|uniref:PDZ domain-containing protein n=1 Tax=Thioalkalicoccus limnaeus TaxID=120681 RepID=A0ABV4B9T9_9GAMM
MKPDYPLTYRVQLTAPATHLFDVELSVSRPPGSQVILSLPAWIPGSYLIRDFARHIVTLTAEDELGERRCDKVDKQTWRLNDVRGDLTIRYRVFAWDLSVRAAHMDTTHAYFNGTCLFLRVLGMDQMPCRVELIKPAGADYANWRVATSLRRLTAPPFGFGDYYALDYADLIDHPVEMGHFELAGFRVRDIPHWIAITGRHDAHLERLGQDLARVGEQQADLFGELPLDRYLFLVTVLDEGYGGLEHGYSSSLICSRHDLPHARLDRPDDGYRRFLGLCSHEYFHLWHIKRIRPQALIDASLTEETPTRTLWAFEGITAYYDDLILVRAGLIDESAYLDQLAQTITQLVRWPGRRVQTLAASSFDAWIKLYKPDENTPNAVVSYYTKGAVVALLLDLMIRRVTQDSRSLDDVMRALWERHGRTGLGVAERGIEALASEIAGADLRDFFDQALDSTSELDIADAIAHVGLAMRLRPMRGPKDLGGFVARWDDLPASVGLGVGLRPTSVEPVIQHVLTGTAAERAGLAPGDTLIAVDGIRVTRDNLDAVLQRLTVGAKVRIHAFRRDELMACDLVLEPAPADTCELCLIDETSPERTQRRAAWLHAPGSC